MDPIQLLKHLNQRGIKLTLRGDRLQLDAPKGALTPDLKQALRASKDYLLAHLKNQPKPLSFEQARLWLLDQAGANDAYNMWHDVYLSGPLDAQVLELCLQQQVDR